MFQNVSGNNYFGTENTFNNGVDSISELALVHANVNQPLIAIRSQ